MMRLCSVLAVAWAASPLVAEEPSFERLSERPRIADDESWETHFNTNRNLLVSFEDDSELPPVSSGTGGHVCYDEYCQPALTLRAGGLMLFLEDTNKTISPIQNLDGSGGYYVQAIRHGEAFDYEAMFFGVGGLDGDALSLLGPGFVSTQAFASLYNYEFNIRQPLTRRISFLTGFRWIDLDTGINLAFPGASEQILIDNDLYGFQIGLASTVLQTDRFQFDATWKGGIYLDNINQSVAATTLPVPLTGSGGATSFATDLWLSLLYRINCHTGVRIGYQLIYLNGIAGQSDIASLVGFGGGDLARSDAFLHGFHGALEWTY